MKPLVGARAGSSSNRLAIVACCLLCSGLWASAGPTGLVVAGGTLLVWLGLGAPYALAGSVVGLAASTPSEPAIETIWLPIAGSVCVLWSESGPATSSRDRLVTLASIACLLALGGLVYTIQPASIWLSGAVVVGCTAGLSVLYRRHKRTELEARALETVTTTIERGRVEPDGGHERTTAATTADRDGETDDRDADTSANP